MEEIWKDVVGFEDYFQISSFGRLFGKRSGKVLKLSNVGGYLAHTTRLNGRNSRSICLKIHKLVAEAFLTKICDSHVVNHIDGVKTNNRVENLEYVTQQENVIHAFRTGLNKPKARHSDRKISDEQVELLFSMYASGSYTYRDLSHVFGIHYSTIGRILRKETYVL